MSIIIRVFKHFFSGYLDFKVEYVLVMKWSDRVRQKMAEKGWSGAELARRAELDPKTLYKYLEGKIQQPRGNTLGKLAKQLGVTEQWLIYGSSETTLINKNPLLEHHDTLQVPIINDTIFRSLCRGDTSYSNILSGSSLMPFIKKDLHSNEIVLLPISDDNNATDLNPGDMVYVDLNLAPVHGKLAALYLGDTVLVGMYTLAVIDGKAVDIIHFQNESKKLPDIALQDVTTDRICRVVGLYKNH